ncbi:cyclic peptide export ABC transporter [Methylobacterium sp. C25]|uniref:cyclic peptide export ABC transporter n=1 Tax=Methylobacterium sp. C25 TaxID=2721622 RepID=UPI002D7E8B5F|nr:cyclic peptide export ABC transporter [Methylobacterium sp. C25]
MMTSRGAPDASVFGLMRPYAPLIAGCAVLGGVGGLSVAGLLAVVNRGLHAGPDQGSALVLAFAGLCILALIGSIGSDIGTNFVGQRIIAALRKALAARILAAPIEALERYRSHRLIPVLTHDVDTISDFAFVLSSFAVSLTISIGCLIYLAMLSLPMFAVVALAVVIGVAVQAWAQVRGVLGFHAARDGEDRLQKNYRAIAEGAKELRIHRGRRRRIYAGQLNATIDWICEKQISAITLFVSARAFGTALFFLVIGLVLGLRQWVWTDMEASAASGFVLVLLYMRGPVDQIISALPAMSRTLVALRRVNDLTAQFSNPEQGLLSSLHSPEPETSKQIRSITLRQASYAFPASGDAAPFVLGPVDLEIRAGEIVFVVGENGSGKTTLIKLLLALYEPASGGLLLDGVPVTAETRDAYRQLFTTVFSDYYLFEDLVGSDADVPPEANRYLERLEVAHKVSVNDGVLSTVDLSTGQRKRLALLNAWLEGRPVLVFDEWAADQDPTFRGIFYRELLPDLQRLGKTIVVISHDDRYFDAADRVVRIAGGRVVAEERAAVTA